jgi:hypothetical protein
MVTATSQAHAIQIFIKIFFSMIDFWGRILPRNEEGGEGGKEGRKKSSLQGTKII